MQESPIKFPIPFREFEDFCLGGSKGCVAYSPFFSACLSEFVIPKVNNNSFTLTIPEDKEKLILKHMMDENTYKKLS